MPEQVVPGLKGRILCIGMDLLLLQTRQLLLNSKNYDSAIALPGVVNRELLAGGFDLLIISVSVGRMESNRIVALKAGNTRTLVLDTLVMPDELLGMIEEALAGS